MESKAPYRAEIAVIGGTGLESLLKGIKQIRVGTPYGLPPLIYLGEVQGRAVAFLPRHGLGHSVPPHRVNYRGNIYALNRLGVGRIVATNAVGAINPSFGLGDLVVPHDLVDFSKQRPSTFHDDAPVIHIDFSQPYCPEIRAVLIEKAKEASMTAREQAVYVCTEGPRFETPAEIRMFRALGCDVVGMTGVPEAVLARELGMCYAALCFVSNMAAGMGQRITSREVMELSVSMGPKIAGVLTGVIGHIPQKRSCLCGSSIEESRIGEAGKC